MKKELFQKKANSLAMAYTKEELAKKLVEKKDSRISNLLASAYNKKILVSKTRLDYLKTLGFDRYEKDAISYFVQKCKTYGPQSWIYKILENDERVNYQERAWVKFLNAVEYKGLKDPDTLDRIWEYACLEALDQLKV